MATKYLYCRLTMRRIVCCLLPALGLVTPVVTAQTRPVSILTHTVALEDWGFNDIAQLRFGRVAIIAVSPQPRLGVRRLRDAIPPAVPLRVRNVTRSTAGNSLVVADFGRSNRTDLGGYFNAFAHQPREALATVVRKADGRRALELSCNNQESGFCGLSIQLYDAEATYDERRYLDARSFSTLSFWVRGHHGHERILLKIADAEWELKEDALPIGEVADWLPAARIDTAWQQVVIPFSLLPGQIQRETLAMLVVEVMSLGATTVDLGPFAFSSTPDSLPPLPEPVTTAEPFQPPHKATWIWNTVELLDDPNHRVALLDFLNREGFDRVFLQLPDGSDRRGDPGELTLDGDRLRPLLAAFHNRGIRVYALDGDAEYARPRFREGVLNTVDNVIRYNKESDENERFYGIRHDIEPYTLPGFHGARRESLLRGLLGLTAAAVARARAGGLVYGVDIPFWYDAPGEYTHEQVTVEFKGAEKPVSEHLIDLADDVSVMDYRTIAYGGDGTIRHASGEIEYAAAQGKSVFVGLETGALPDEILLEFRGAPKPGLPETMPADAIIILAPAGDSARVFHVPESARRDSTIDATLAESFEEQKVDPSTLWWWPVSRRVDVPAAKITFAHHGVVRLDAVMEETAAEFAKYESFAGFAIHFAPSYMALVRSRPN